MNGGLLDASLQLAVPLWADRLRMTPMQQLVQQHVTHFGQELGERGDVLLFGGKKGEAAALFNKLAAAVAVMSFCPGGVLVFGTRYQNEHGLGPTTAQQVPPNMARLLRTQECK